MNHDLIRVDIWPEENQSGTLLGAAYRADHTGIGLPLYARGVEPRLITDLPEDGTWVWMNNQHGSFMNQAGPDKWRYPVRRATHWLPMPSFEGVGG